MSTQDVALSVEAQRLLDLLPVDATGMGNVTLRRSLGLSEDEYHRAVAELDADPDPQVRAAVAGATACPPACSPSSSRMRGQRCVPRRRQW